MKILLLGEYSNVHATLAEGLRALGHHVVVASDGDDWKNYPRDIDLRRPKHGRLSDIVFYLRLLKKFLTFRDFDIVQIINPVFLPLKAERIRRFYRYLRKHNKKIFMGAFGMDYYYVKACIDCKTFRYSDFNIGSHLRHTKETEQWRKDWLIGAKGKLNREIAQDADGIIAGLYEYFAAYSQDFRDKLTFIPFPIRPDADAVPRKTEEKIKFFIGIQRLRSAYKGTDIMLSALEKTAAKYPEKCEMVKVESVPFKEYTELLRGSDVLLDQLYSYTPAMNALEAMARGLVVVGGGEPENYSILNEAELRPIINVLPCEEDVCQKLEQLLEHPDQTEQLKNDALSYIEKHHHYVKVAQRYLNFWSK